jgi:addiction module HigA family antidote
MRKRQKSSTVTERAQMVRMLPPVHPGEVLVEEYLEPLGLSQYALAKATGIPVARINRIALGKRAITAETALRLARYFGTSVGFWVNLQSQYEVAVATRKFGAKVERDVRPRAA